MMMIVASSSSSSSSSPSSSRGVYRTVRCRFSSNNNGDDGNVRTKNRFRWTGNKYISSKFVEETIKCHRNGSSRTESRESARILRRFSAGVRFASLGDASNRASKGCLYFGNSDEGDDDDGGRRRTPRGSAIVTAAATAASAATASDILKNGDIYDDGNNNNHHRTTERLRTIRRAKALKTIQKIQLSASIKRKVAIFVEPSPFTHVSGMKNRFLRLIENLSELGDEVVVITPCVDPPKEYCGCKVIGVKGIVLPFYGTDTLLLSTGLSKRVFEDFKDKKPDLIHCSTPGMMINAAIFYSKVFDVPLVQSYHTHIPHYIPRYIPSAFGFASFLQRRMWDLIRMWSSFAQTTMVTSSIMEEELRAMGCSRLQVWQKGVDTVAFNPKYKDEAFARRVLTEGRDGPIIGCVGRLGAEKNLYALKEMLSYLPSDTNVAIIGDGPERKALEKHFEGTRTTFTGMITGEDLSRAYASLDVFAMPSESETLGFVVMEAMASGVPVVAVAAGGLLDIMTNCDGKAGDLYPSGDYAKAGALIKDLLTDREKLQRYSQASLEYVAQWSWMSSNKLLRDRQYLKAVKRHWKENFGKERAKKIKIRQTVAKFLNAVTFGQFFLTFFFFLGAVGILIAGKNFELPASVVKKAALTQANSANNGIVQTAVVAIEAAIVKYGVFAAMSANVAMIALAGIFPFMPTLPFFIASGLFFGASSGTLLNLTGATLAAVIASSISRAAVSKTSASSGYAPADELSVLKGFTAPIRRFLKSQISKVKNAIARDGTLFSQSSSVAVLRMLPHAPFTVASYMLGCVKDLQIRAVLLGTLVGSVPWATFYALVGASGKTLLTTAKAKTAPELALFANEKIVDALIHAETLVPKLMTLGECILVGFALVLLILRVPAAPADGLLTISSSSKSTDAASSSR